MPRLKFSSKRVSSHWEHRFPLMAADRGIREEKCLPFAPSSRAPPGTGGWLVGTVWTDWRAVAVFAQIDVHAVAAPQHASAYAGLVTTIAAIGSTIATKVIGYELIDVAAFELRGPVHSASGFVMPHWTLEVAIATSETL
jgi:hypothetical protein